MLRKTENQDVGASFSGIAVIATVLALLMISVGIYLYRTATTEVAYKKIVIATGSETGTYHALGGALKRLLQSSGLFESVEVLPTDGSEDNIRLIGMADGEVDLAFAQADASVNNRSRLVSTLYDEVLHILINQSAAGSMSTVYDLQGKRVSLGPAGSGTRELSTRVLRHFGIQLAEDLVLAPKEAAEQLSAGMIDAVFMLSAIPSKLIAELASEDQIRFLSLGKAPTVGDEADALALVFPGVHSATIPRSTYMRIPRQAVHTISVSAILVARADLDEELVRQITAVIFASRAGSTGLTGSGLLVARKIRENYDPSRAAVPYHPGATAYYRREDPPFFVQYAEALSLGVTVLLAMYSMFIAVREWSRRRMKNRVDAYLVQVETLVADRHSLEPGDLQHQLDQLEQLRREAFADLIAERLLADEAFTILQNHLRDELAAIRQLINAGSMR
ncbi:MAG: TAXI family TRAP transporter solute-binding subunit [Halioglobus sp.]